MSWLVHHKQSENLASEAHENLRAGDSARAVRLFKEAAQAEVLALGSLTPDKQRTIGVTAVSAVALWYRAGELDEAERLAHRSSALAGLPHFAKEQLRSLLQAIWNEYAQKKSGVSFLPGQVLVSVRGGDVITGGAPLDLIVEKVQGVQNLFYRTAEYLKALPLRKSGPPSKEVQERCKPWLFQSVPGSYQFAVAIQKPSQRELFPVDDLDPERLSHTFLSILKAAGDNSDEQMKTLVEDNGYRQTFLKMTRNLAPTGKKFSELEIRGTGDNAPVILSVISRKLISETLRAGKANLPGEAGQREVIEGVLRAVDLDADWITVAVDGESKTVKGIGTNVDDVIGPMVNHEVVVHVLRNQNRLKFIDIERRE
jgi:hypothetical protein